FRAQLLLALYRSGRQADALKAYAAARSTLVEQLGTEPSAELQELQRAILNQDAALAAPAGVTPVEAAAAPEEARKPVTILLAELAATSPDPEARREELRRSQRKAAAALAAHGGEPGRTGDMRVLGIFGVPTAREDDALRAVRAACELRAAGLVVRAGVATGDIITGDPAEGRPRVSGPPLEEADRLLASARAEVLVGDRTWRLVRHAVAAERREGGHAVERVHEEAEPVVRRLETPLVGREEELNEIMAAFRRATRDGRARLVTVFGSPGVGKTRLAREVIDRLAGTATCLVGRTPAYGDAATYAPLRDALQPVAAGPIRGWAAAVLAADPDGEVVTLRVAAAVGEAPETAPVDETAWAIRRLFEALARRRPVVLVLEDLHWATPAFLDLVEHIVQLGQGPLLLLALARPELIDTRPDWGGGGLSASSTLLDTLPAGDAEALLDALAARTALSGERRSRILAAAGGNPLFLEQLVAAARERDDAAIPDTIHALLSARLDQLGERERRVAQAAAVCGESFPAGIVEQLVGGDVRDALLTLAQRDFVEPDTPRMPDEDRWAFRHALVRDEAYASLPKRRRAALHERAAEIVAGLAAGRGLDVDELVGYHLDAAYRSLAEVDPAAPELDPLAAEAGARLGAAGRRAYGELDIQSAARLLARAAELLPPGNAQRLAFTPHLVDALCWADRRDEAIRVLDESDAAADPADEHVKARLVVARCNVSMWGGTPRDPGEVLDDLRGAMSVLAEAGDDEMLAAAHLVGFHASERVRGLGDAYTMGAPNLQDAVRHAREAGARSAESAAISWLCVILRRGPWPIDEAMETVQSALDDPPTRFARGSALGGLACLRAMEGRFDEARALAAESHAVFEDAALPQMSSADLIQVADVEIIAGDLEAAEPILRRAIDRTGAVSDVFSMANAAWRLALVLVGQGRDDEAELYVERAGEADAGVVVKMWRQVIQATIEARRGNAERAAALLAEAEEPMLEARIGLTADLCVQAAEAAALAGLTAKAVAYLERAAAVAGPLGYTVTETRARERLAELDYAADTL
ncbi:MAG: ATP-binding protein, partial [Gaiellaceae bacterium]